MIRDEQMPCRNTWGNATLLLSQLLLIMPIPAVVTGTRPLGILNCLCAFILTIMLTHALHATDAPSQYWCRLLWEVVIFPSACLALAAGIMRIM